MKGLLKAEPFSFYSGGFVGSIEADVALWKRIRKRLGGRREDFVEVGPCLELIARVNMAAASHSSSLRTEMVTLLHRFAAQMARVTCRANNLLDDHSAAQGGLSISEAKELAAILLMNEVAVAWMLREYSLRSPVALILLAESQAVLRSAGERLLRSTMSQLMAVTRVDETQTARQLPFLVLENARSAIFLALGEAGMRVGSVTARKVLRVYLDTRGFNLYLERVEAGGLGHSLEVYVDFSVQVIGSSTCQFVVRRENGAVLHNVQLPVELVQDALDQKETRDTTFEASASVREALEFIRSRKLVNCCAVAASIVDLVCLDQSCVAEWVQLASFCKVKKKANLTNLVQKAGSLSWVAFPADLIWMRSSAAEFPVGVLTALTSLTGGGVAVAPCVTLFPLAFSRSRCRGGVFVSPFWMKPLDSSLESLDWWTADPSLLQNDQILSTDFGDDDEDELLRGEAGDIGLLEIPMTRVGEKTEVPDTTQPRVRDVARVDPKVFWANERTFLSWLGVSVFLAVYAASLMTFGDVAPRIAGTVMVPIAIIIAVYALIRFQLRLSAIVQAGSGMNHVIDRWGPWVLVIVLCLMALALTLLSYFYGTI